MNAEKITTLQQLLPVKDELLEACMQEDLSSKERKALDQALVKLNAVERSIIETLEEELVDVLKKDSEELNTLAEKISCESEKLLNIAQTIRKVSELTNALAQVITGALSIGVKSS